MSARPRLVSVQVGLPRDVAWNGQAVRTSIFKEPVAGRVRVGCTDLAGNAQVDLDAHGGDDKAVYAYPSEHYPFWAGELPGALLPFGAFGENFTTEGMLETDLAIGDVLRIGSAVLRVTQPRLPCFKLGIRLGTHDAAKRFTASLRPGFYLGVVQEGEVGAGDAIEVVERDPRRLTVTEVFALRVGALDDAQGLRRAALHPWLTAGWREHFRRRLVA